MEPNNGGTWGSWDEWKYCPQGYYVCGFQTQVECYGADETSLNNVDMVCCQEETRVQKTNIRLDNHWF
jgi:hypothetical protein